MKEGRVEDFNQAFFEATFANVLINNGHITPDDLRFNNKAPFYVCCLEEDRIDTKRLMDAIGPVEAIPVITTVYQQIRPAEKVIFDGSNNGQQNGSTQNPPWSGKTMEAQLKYPGGLMKSKDPSEIKRGLGRHSE